MATAAKKAKTKTKIKARVSAKKKAKIPARKAKKKITKRLAKKTTKKIAKKSKPAKKVLKKPAAKSAKKIKKTTTIAVSTPALETTPRVAAGDLAPAFTLQDQNGTQVSLESFKGRKVVLYFYPKDDTPGCTKEACSFRDNLGFIDGADAVILGVSFDDGESHQKFIAKYQLNFSLLSDINKEVADAYGCYVEKNMYGNISKGIERSTFVIDREGKIAAAFRRVQVDGHTEQVLEALKAIP